MTHPRDNSKLIKLFEHDSLEAFYKSKELKMLDQDGNIIDLHEKERQERLANNQMSYQQKEAEDSAYIIIWVVGMSIVWLILYLVYKLVW